MAKPKFGFTYPTVTGENKITAFRRVKTEFPQMQIWSDYQNGTDLPVWNDPWFVEAPAGCIFLVSIKHTNVNDVGNRIAQMPTNLRGRVFIFLHHEPDQWRSASDPRSDPDPTTWINRQIAFANLRANAAWKDWVQHWVCFTEDRLRTDTVAWEQNWGDTFQDEPRIDGVAFDCFNIGRSITRVGSDIFGKPVEFARREGVKLIIREYGQVVPVDTANDSQAVADQIRENWAYAKTQNEQDDVFFGLVWYYNHNNTIVDPSGNRPGRPLTRDALEEIMADAALVEEDPEDPTEEPDPEHPQYQFGRASRDAEVADLNEALLDLEAELPRQRTAGRNEAFTETRDWAANKIV
jgi:hypothetical protein